MPHKDVLGKNKVVAVAVIIVAVVVDLQMGRETNSTSNK